MASKNQTILDSFGNFSVLVIGDVILDRYIWGHVGRISPEAPVPLVEVTGENFMVGGAANVAHNVVALGGSATVVGVVGNDGYGRIFKEQLEKKNIGHALFEDDRATTLKTRVIAHNQQMVRIDKEDRGKICGQVQESILKYIRRGVAEHDAVLVSDYNKGVVTRDIVKEIIRAARPGNKFIAVDPRVQNLGCYKGVSMVKPNIMEASQCSGVEIRDEKTLLRAARVLLKKISCRTLLITRGADGMSLFEPGWAVNIPTVARKVYDVTGAGDTVIAAFTLARLSGATNQEAANIANHAAGLVVGEIGTAVTTPRKLLRSLALNGDNSTTRRFAGE